MIPRRGVVYLVGAGPGDPELMTLRGLKALRRADVVVHDRLIDPKLLRRARAGAELIDVGKSRGSHRRIQAHINQLLVDHARRGFCVVRLKGGDPFVFGRGFEELSACREAGVDCVVIPGVSSAVAAPAAAGIPVTFRGVARSFAVLTAESADDDSAGVVELAGLEGVDTLVFLMGRANLPRIARGLIAAGRDAQTPVACIEHATTPHQRVVTGTLADIAETAERAGLSAPMVIVVGEVASLAVETVCAGGGLPAHKGRRYNDLHPLRTRDE
ncbi:MAG: uroporphyrinogen-III C-methyltransferase [Planctomycetota bacterium]